MPVSKGSARVSLWLLGACYFFSITITFMHVATTNIASKEIVDVARFTPGLATLALCLLLANSAAVIAPAGWLFKRFTYRNVFLIGALFAVLGGAMCCAAMLLRGGLAFAVLCLGVIPSGLSIGVVNYYRHVAALIGGNDESLRAQNVAIVITGAALSGAAGPGFATLTKDLIPGHKYAGVYMCVTIISILHFIILCFVDVSAVDDVGHVSEAIPPRPLGQIVRQLDFAVALVNGTVATCVMVLMMGITPLVLNAQGATFLHSSIVVATHVVCMYTPSFVTSALIKRFSARSLFIPGALTSGIGVLFFTYKTSPDASEHERWLNFALALAGLCIIGIGWNASFVAATTQLGSTHRPAEKFRAHALNDTSIWSFNALMTLVSGFLLEYVGRIVIVVGAVFAYAALLALNCVYVYIERRRRRYTAVKIVIRRPTEDDEKLDVVGDRGGFDSNDYVDKRWSL